MLHHPAAVILQRPGIGLDGALRIGMAAEMHEIAADRIVADQRDKAGERGAVKRLGAKAVMRRIGGGAAIRSELRLVEGDADAAWPELGGIAEQLVHLRPEPLLLDEERAEMMGGAAAVAPRRLPADDALVDHQHVGTG